MGDKSGDKKLSIASFLFTEIKFKIQSPSSPAIAFKQEWRREVFKGNIRKLTSLPFQWWQNRMRLHGAVQGVLGTENLMGSELSPGSTRCHLLTDDWWILLGEYSFRYRMTNEGWLPITHHSAERRWVQIMNQHNLTLNYWAWNWNLRDA